MRKAILRTRVSLSAVLILLIVGCTERTDYVLEQSYIDVRAVSLSYLNDDTEVYVRQMTSFNSRDEYVSFEIGQSRNKALYMDIYGCEDINCQSATAIVFHDSSYSYVKSLNKGEFRFSKPAQAIRSQAFGDDCEIQIYAHWNLTIDTKSVKIDWTFQEAEETCEVFLYK